MIVSLYLSAQVWVYAGDEFPGRPSIATAHCGN